MPRLFLSHDLESSGESLQGSLNSSDQAGLASARGRPPERAGSVTGGRKEKKAEREGTETGASKMGVMSGVETKEVEAAMAKSALSFKNAKLQGMLMELID